MTEKQWEHCAHDQILAKSLWTFLLFEGKLVQQNISTQNHIFKNLHQASCTSVQRVNMSMATIEQSISTGLFQTGPWWSILKVSKVGRNPLQSSACPVLMREQRVAIHANLSWKKVFWKSVLVLKILINIYWWGKARKGRRMKDLPHKRK